ncbi:MAG: helix-turn-helix transcriptional regulator [Gemmatimonadota bacterium]|nr:helix-turn-helix transcriptional regulator [Gemmatimonadota bacterium]
MTGEFASTIMIDNTTRQVVHTYQSGADPTWQVGWNHAAIGVLGTLQMMRQDQLLHCMLEAHVLDEPATFLSLISEDQFIRLDFHREWMAPRGFRDGVGVPVAYTAERTMMVGFASSRPIGPEYVTLLGRLSPHLRRALMIGETLERARWEAQVALAALARIDTPILICSGTGNLVFVNPAGEAALGKDGSLRVSNGRLEPRSTSIAANFSEALQRAVRDDLSLGRRGIGIPLGTAHAYILPLLGEGVRRVADRPLAAIFLSTSRSLSLPEESVLMALFGLTPTEALIMSRIARGQAASALKDTLGISANTIKTHLSHIFRKTGCASQVDLVRLMAELSLPIVTEANHSG